MERRTALEVLVGSAVSTTCGSSLPNTFTSSKSPLIPGPTSCFSFPARRINCSISSQR